MHVGCTVWDMKNVEIVLKLQCQSCKHYTQHPINVLSHFSYAKHVVESSMSQSFLVPVPQRCKHFEIGTDLIVSFLVLKISNKLVSVLHNQLITR